MDPSMVIPEVVGIGLFYGLLPAIAIQAGAARRPRLVACPADGTSAAVRLDVGQAVRALFTDDPPRVTDCSHWPERAGCDRACEACVRV